MTEFFTGVGTGHIKRQVGDALQAGQFMGKNGPKLLKRKNREAKRRRDIAMTMETTVVKMWLQDRTVTDIASQMGSTIPIINGILRRFRTQQLEANEESKEQLVADQISKLKRLAVTLQMDLELEGDAALTFAQKLKTADSIRRIQKDISELLGLTRGTVVHNIKEMKLYDIDLSTFPAPVEKVKGVGNQPKMLKATVVVPEPDAPETFKDQRTTYEDELETPVDRVFLPDGSSVPRETVQA